jgi:hypothetical protein
MVGKLLVRVATKLFGFSGKILFNRPLKASFGGFQTQTPTFCNK